MLIPLFKDIDIIVNSYGGVGTTFLINYLSQFKSVNNKVTMGNYDFYKHINQPPLTLKKNVKAIYVVGNPVEAIYSIFLREYQFSHIRKLRFGEVDDFSTLHLKIKDIETFAKYDEDLFCLNKHINNWVKSRYQHYDILVIKYDKIWDNIPFILKYCGIKDDPSNFPARKERRSTSDNIPNDILSSLKKIYLDADKTYRNLPDKMVILAKQHKYYLNLFRLPYLLHKYPYLR